MTSDANSELADFLRKARDSVDPARAGLPLTDRPRRVPGLRREEVALLAGVSADYYTRLEQGRRIIPSWAVLDALARALDLDFAGRAHLGNLVGSTTEARRPLSGAPQVVRPGMQQFIASLDGTPAIILGRRTDVLATNRLARALLANFDRMLPPDRNYARWVFLSPRAHALFHEWDEHARTVVERLRLDFASYPEDPVSIALVDELRAASTRFTEWWDAHRVHQSAHGVHRLCHPVLGEITVYYESLELPGDPDQTLLVYSTEPASPSRRALDRLIDPALSETTTPVPRAQPAAERDEPTVELDLSTTAAASQSEGFRPGT